MGITIIEHDVVSLSPEAQAAAKGLMSWYGKALLFTHVTVYSGIVISGMLLLLGGGEVDPTGSAIVWLSQGVTALLVGRELAPVVSYWFKSLRRKRQPSTFERNLAAGVSRGLPPSKQPKITKPRDRKGYVYLLESPSTPGLYKIGRTVDPKDRIKTFAVKLPFEVQYVCVIKTDDMYSLEKLLHRMFDNNRVNGEWFFLLQDDIDYIKHKAEQSQIKPIP